MRASSRIAAALLALVAGCRSGGPGPVWRSLALTPDVGTLAFASAPEMYSDTLVAANTQRLFVCVVAVCPGLHGGLRDGSNSYRERLVTSSWTWQTNVGDVSLSLSWDQRADTVELGGSRYSRAAGNTFVARYEHPGHWVIQQLASIPIPRALGDALEQIQRQLPEDPVVASLSLTPELNRGIIQRP